MANRSPKSIVLILALLVPAGAAVGLGARYRLDRQESTRELLASTPADSRADDFVSSAACQACHPSQYASWHDSYHRTMTQRATPETVLGDFDDVTVDYFGRPYRLERRGEEFWVVIGDQEHRIVQTTGSHHYQMYWYRAGEGSWLEALPLVYLLDERRWARRNDVFILPPELAELPEDARVWNRTCIRCHSTHGKPRLDSRTKHAETEVAELGIACEACHGPAAEHVALNRDPRRRYERYGSDEADPSIFNPERASSKRASQVCGQCHSIFDVLDRERWNRDGFVYRAGASLETVRIVARHPRRARQSWQDEQSADFFDKYWWPDGEVRVSGREYNGLIESPCYRHGELSCLSCHSMHDSDPNDQLATGMETDEACLQCHDEYRDRIAEHSHHPADSSGSRCYNCHMPHTTYGLVKAIRSHEVTVPDVAASRFSGRTHACNLCHLDRSLGWTMDTVEQWYGSQPVPLTRDEREISAALLAILRGDAGQRAIAAWHMGWEPALQASGRGWIAPFLAELLDDPYTAVRVIAGRSLAGLPRFGEFDPDFSAGPADRARQTEGARRHWSDSALDSLDRVGPAVLIGEDRTVMEEEIRRLLAGRDHRPVDLLE